MKNTFRQGLISFQKDGNGSPQFLLASTTNGYVQLNVAPSPTLVTFAHGSSDYLAAFDTTLPTAWGPLVNGKDNYLYWDIDLLTSNISYGITTLEPVVSLLTPSNPANGQMWFDLNTHKMLVWQSISNKWIEKVRVIAGVVENGNVAQIVSKTQGTQVGLTGPSQPGFIMLDSHLYPLRTSAGEFLTTDTPVRIKTTVGTSGVLATPPNAFVSVRAGENLPPMSLVYFAAEDTVSLASGEPSELFRKTPVGLVQEALAQNEIGVLTQSSEITYDQWDWSGHIGKGVYSTSDGKITTARPGGLLAYRVGFIKNKNTIVFGIDTETMSRVYTASPNSVVISGFAPVTTSDVINDIGERVVSISVPLATNLTPGLITSAQINQINNVEARFVSIESDVATLETSKANTVHTHVIADTTGLQLALDSKFPITGNFDGRYALLDHNHDDRYALIIHTHTIPDVSGLQEALNDKSSRSAGLIPFGRVFEVVNQTGLGDVGVGMTLPQALDGKAPVVHTHTISDIIDLGNELSNKALINHTHIISQINGLQIALDSKLSSVPPIDLSGLSNVKLTALLPSQVLTYDGTNWVNRDVAAGGTGTDIQYTAGDGITIANGVISLTTTQTGGGGGIQYTAGDGITIANGVISLTTQGGGSVIQYTAGDGITIANGVISLTTSGGTSGSNHSAGLISSVQISDGIGGFVGIAPGTDGQILTSHGLDSPTWEPPIVSGGTVTSVNIQGQDTGLTFTGGPITKDGIFLVDGILSLSHGGTGANSVSGAIANLLPDQATAPIGATLVTDGVSLSWALQPGASYSAGVGIKLNGNVFNSTVADNTGDAYRVTISKGDGTLVNLPAGTSGYVLTSAGPSAGPTWQNVSGTVSDIAIYNDPTMGLQISGGDAYSPAVPYSTHISETGTISLSGVLSVLHGGTGAGTAFDARAKLLPPWPKTPGPVVVLAAGPGDVFWRSPFPDQAGNGGKFLTSNGVDVSWTFPDTSGTVTSIDISGGTTGLTTSGGPITDSGVITLGGVLKEINGGTNGKLSIRYGGTGADNPTDAINGLVPSQGNNAGKILTTDGTAVSWTSSSAGSVTSIEVDGGVSGFSFAGGPVTQAGKITLGGILRVTSGGTGGASPFDARTNLLPPQANQDGKVLTTNGTDARWQTPTASIVQSINPGTTGLTFDTPTNGVINVGGVVSVASGGTGKSDPVGAINALMPNQNGQTGKILTTDGVLVSWGTASAGSVTSVNVSGSTTGLTFSGGPITSSGLITLGGTLSIQNGGTGASSAIDARNSLLPDQTTSVGQYLSTNGTNVLWKTIPASGTVSSVGVSGGTTGLTTTGGPITSTGTITFGGTLAVASGGTGATTPTAALTALLPTQTGQTGKVLSSNGTAATWAAASSFVTAAGSPNQVQFNLAGSFAASSSFTFTANVLAVPSISTTSVVDLVGSIRGGISDLGGGSSMDCSLANYFTKTAAGSNTWSFANVPTGRVFIVILALKNGGSGVQTWPTSVVWSSATAPTLSGASTDELVFCTDNGGTSWRGSYTLGFTA